MKTSRYTEAQILSILRQAEGGMPVAQLCRDHGMSNASLYKWRAKYGGMDASLISQMKAMDRAMVRHWFKDNGEGEPAAQEDVHRTQHAERTAELRR